MSHDLFRAQEEIEEWALYHDAVQTGSRAWETANYNSDYDYVLSLEDAEELKTMLDPGYLVVNPHTYFEKGYFISDGDSFLINIIAIPKDQVEVWKIATDMLKAAPCKRIPKNFIHILFMAIRTVLEKGGLDK